MLSPAALRVADRLSLILMALLEAVAALADTPDPTTPYAGEANTLLTRLLDLVHRLLDLTAFGRRPRPRGNAAARPTRRSPAKPRRPVPGLPRRAGWIVEAMPETAPDIVADLRTLLADPALAELLAATPAIGRALRQILRGLGLTNTKSPPEPPPPGTGARTEPHRTAAPTRQTATSKTTRQHHSSTRDYIVTKS